MSLLAFIVRRLVAMAFVLFGVVAITFFLVRLAPGDPVTQQLGIQHAGDTLTYHRLYHQMGLDRPLWRQFLSYLWNALHGDLGDSLTVQPGTPVTMIIGQGLPVTLELGAMATLVALLIGVPLGILAAVRQNRLIADHLNTGLMMAFYALPPFVLIPVVWEVFGITLKDTFFHLPVSGWEGLEHPRSWIAPVSVFAIGIAGFFARSMRSFMLEELHREYIRTARAKGLPRSRVVYVHALKNTLVPFASVLGPSVAFLVVGAFVIEQLFGIPGVAYAAVQASQANDYSVTLGIVLVLATAVVLVNALTDIFYTIVDPRVRL